MITVTFLQSDSLLYGFEIKGHSGSANSGQDVICASVSSAAYMTANTITDVICAGCDQLKVDDGYMLLTVSSSDANKCSDILNGFKIHITQLSQQYAKFIKIIGGNTDA